MENIKYIGGGQKLYYLYYLYSFKELYGFTTYMKSIFFEVKTVFFGLLLMKSLGKIKNLYKNIYQNQLYQFQKEIKYEKSTLSDKIYLLTEPNIKIEIGENQMSQNTKTILSNLFTLTSELSEPTSNLINIEGTSEKPATQKDLAKGLHENLIHLTEALGLSVDELTTEQQEDEPQQTLKSMIKDIQDMTFKAHELSGGAPDVFGSMISGEIDRLAETLGMIDLSITAEVEENLPENTLKSQLQDLHALNNSMFYNDDKYGTPRFTDGTEITAKDLADMNINALDNIAELIGFELDE